MDSHVSKNTFCYILFNLDINEEHLAIKKLLKKQLIEIIQVYQSKINLETELSSIEAIIFDKIALYFLDKIYLQNIVYRCAIAFPLANYWHLSPLKVAQNLKEFLLTNDVISTTQPILELEVQIVSPGWIDFYLSDRALVVWLEAVVGWVSQEQGDGEDDENRGDRENEHLFVIQYAHARCCSLLRLGHQEKLIKIKSQYLSWEIVEPINFAWVNAQGIFVLRHLTEKRLLFQLLMIVDELITSSNNYNWAKLAHNLSEALLDFWTECCIYGEIKQKTPELAQARLGLVALAQYFLARILRDKLYLSPWTKL